MKTIQLFTVLVLLSWNLTTPAAAQSRAEKVKKAPVSASAPVALQHRIVFQLVTNDTLAHKALLRQLGNILATDPSAKLEVVCHGPGVDLLVASKSRLGGKIDAFKNRGVAFHACEFTLREKKIAASELFPGTTTVPAGILALSERQMQGWTYIKAGF
jgi:hypothetical protein